MLLLFILTLCLIRAGGENDWTSMCQGNCKCLWSQGRRAAECVKLQTIPNNLSKNLQLLTLNDNYLNTLPARAFDGVGLVNLHKIFLRNTGLERVNRDALVGLTLLIEIDLSYNNISYLHQDLFRPCWRIREVIVTNNPIHRIEAGLFTNFSYLQRVDFSSCQINKVEVGAFYNVSMLTTLELRNNNLTTMDLAVVDGLTKLKNLGLTNNPWQCDCSLKPLREWVIKWSLYAHATRCSNYDKEWTEVSAEEFACPPEIVAVFPDASGVLACAITGDPPPTVQWMYNSRPITNQSSSQPEYLVSDGNGWYNLTVRKSRGGLYECFASNAGGSVKKGLTLDRSGYEEDDETLFASGRSWWDDMLPLIAGVPLGALLLLCLVLILWCCLSRRQRDGAAKKKDKSGQGGDVEEKTLMHSVNPVQKPPRRPDTSLHSSETELLDSAVHPYKENGSILGTLPSESIPRTPTHSSRGEADTTDPPDLLAFPAKSAQNSPVDSLPPLPQQKPLYSPQFGTLPYARSHSPFSPPIPVVVPRTGGYVTIPRRPRVPSWSASLSPVLVSPECEPIYDNLGPRTTADGSSMLSLNKTGLGSPPRHSWMRTPEIDERASLIGLTSAQPQVVKKTPPNPPPKPKKRFVKGLFDDECEDGTEV